MDEMQKVMEKVRALQNLGAAGSGATEAEASLALERAAALMLKHNLDEEAIRAATGEAVDVSYDLLVHPGKVPPWQGIVAMAVGRAYMVRALHDHEYFYFVGRPVNRVAARDTFTWLRIQIDTLGIHEAGEVKMPDHWPVGRKRSYKRTWKESWLLGCANRVLERVREWNEGGDPQTRGLVISLKDETDTFIRMKWGRLRPGLAQVVTNGAGYNQGHDAGSSISLRDQAKVGGGRLSLGGGS